MQEALQKFLNDTREERLKKERDALIKKRFAELAVAITTHCVTIPRDAIMECHPVAFDLALKADLEPVANASSSENITHKSFAPIIPKIIADWEDEQRKFLRSFLRQFITTKVPRGIDILDLAVAIFYSTSSTSGEVRKMRYPYMLTSYMFRSCDRRHEGLPSDHYAAPARPGSYTSPCDLKHLQPKPVEVGIKWMRNIVTKLGLDPDSATFADLEQCDARLRCLKCAEIKASQFAYTWEAAVSALLPGRGRDAMLILMRALGAVRAYRGTQLHPVLRRVPEVFAQPLGSRQQGGHGEGEGARGCRPRALGGL